MEVIPEVKKQLNFSIKNIEKENLKKIISGQPDNACQQIIKELKSNIKADNYWATFYLILIFSEIVCDYIIKKKEEYVKQDPELLQTIKSRIKNHYVILEDIIFSDMSILIDSQTPIKITITTEKTDSMICYGDWRIVVIVWKPVNTSYYSPSLIITESILINPIEESEDSSLLNLFIFPSIIIAIIVCLYIIYKRLLGTDRIRPTTIRDSEDTQTLVFKKLMLILGSNPQLILDQSTKSNVKFISKELDFIPKLSENWTSTKRILLFQFKNSKNSLELNLSIGPGDKEIRKKIHTIVKQKPNIFNCISNKLSPAYSKIYKKEILSNEDYKKEKNLIYTKIEEQFLDFLKNDLPKIELEIKKSFNSN